MVRPITLVSAALSLLFVPLLYGQDSANKWRTVPGPLPAAPFDPDAASAAAASEVTFLPTDQMTPQDRLQADNAQTSIGEHARINGFDLGAGSWSYSQIVCPALPGHLFLRYTRSQGAGDVTMFSAAVPRGGDGRVRIIPILRRGYSLFSPAPINAMTIAAFNHIRADEPEADRSKGWVGNALCYAALAGGHPQLPAPGAEPMPGKPLPAVTPTLLVKVKEGEEIHFADASGAPHAMEWTMTFSQRGKLVKATHTPAEMERAKPVPNVSPLGPAKAVPQESSN